ncbi:MAG TPA: hypothetical protein VF042_05595 [Gemmatimonadaceae bacterium]
MKRRITNVAGAAAIIVLGGGCLDVNDDPGKVAVLAVVSGSQQNVEVGKAAAQPLVVRAYNNSALGLEGKEIEWTASAGTISASRTTTDDTGASQVTYTAPNLSGTAQVRATSDGITVTFTLTIVAASG